MRQMAILAVRTKTDSKNNKEQLQHISTWDEALADKKAPQLTALRKARGYFALSGFAGQACLQKLAECC